MKGTVHKEERTGPGMQLSWLCLPGISKALVPLQHYINRDGVTEERKKRNNCKYIHMNVLYSTS